MNNREQAAQCIGAIVLVIDTHPELNDIAALLCAVGAACSSPALAEQLLRAIEPIMLAAHVAATGRNN